MTINVTIEKSPVPIIWIDSSIIIMMAKWKYNLSNLSDIEKERIENLYNKIIASIGSRKLICPFAEQEEEIFGGKRDECIDIFNTLTLGIQANSTLGILKSQLRVAIEAHCRSDNDINLSYMNVFLSDPVDKLNRAIDSGFCVTINRGLLFGEQHQKNIKNFKHSKLNEIREVNVVNGKTFALQLEDEYLSRIEVFKYRLSQCATGSFANSFDMENALSTCEMLAMELYMLEAITGNENDMEGLEEFYHSDHYKNIPYPYISCNLSAKLMTDPQPIRSGDFMDSEHAATMMPYVDMFITDNAMKTYLKRQGYDAIYDTKVCYIGDTEEINDFFSSL